MRAVPKRPDTHLSRYYHFPSTMPCKNVVSAPAMIYMDALRATCSGSHQYPQHLVTVARHQVVGRQAEAPPEHQPLTRDHLISVSRVIVRFISTKLSAIWWVKLTKFLDSFIELIHWNEILTNGVQLWICCSEWNHHSRILEIENNVSSLKSTGGTPLTSTAFHATVYISLVQSPGCTAV